jgi:general stress protein 26
MPKPSPKTIREEDISELAKAIVRKVKFPMLATVDRNQPRVRPVSPLRTEGFTVYVGNLRGYRKTAEIAANPKVELCYLDEEHNQVRISGIATVVDDRKLLEEIWQKNRLLQHYLGTIDNPELIVYRIEPSRVRFMQEWALEYIEVPF